MDNTLMKVTQLPVIEEHLRSRKEQTEQRVAEAMSLVCTDETLTSVKNIRAEMNREFADAETQRKAIIYQNGQAHGIRAFDCDRHGAGRPEYHAAARGKAAPDD